MRRSTQAEAEPGVAGQFAQRRDHARRPAHGRGQGRDHRLAGKTRAGQEDGQLQAARLALFSRQRYWGEPFPIVLDEQRPHAAPSPESELPVRLPELEDFKPTGKPEPPLEQGDGLGPLLRASTGARPTRCRSGPARAGTTCATSIPQNDKLPWDPAKERYWMPVDLYVGGAEHAVLHLLYSRFWHKVLFDRGLRQHARAVPEAGQPGDDPGRDRVHRLSRRTRGAGSRPEAERRGPASSRSS